VNNLAFLETLKAEDGKLSHLAYHQARLDSTLLAHGLTPSIDLEALLSPPSNGVFRCRVLYSADTCQVSYHAYARRHLKTLQAVVDDTIEYRWKYADRSHLEKLLSRRGTADEVVIVKNGLITDATIANLALFDGKEWVTPASPLLYGTTRQRLIDEGTLLTREISLDDLDDYSKVALINAMVGFLEVENGIIFPKDRGR
jgi:4-amino-4-deoxychorismate lyase